MFLSRLVCHKELLLYNDLKEITGAFQVTNEMGLDTFTKPLTLEEAAVFIGIQPDALDKVTENFPIGYNSADMSRNLHKRMKPYLWYCDYAGIDLYTGNVDDARACAVCCEGHHRRDVITEKHRGLYNEDRKSY